MTAKPETLWRPSPNFGPRGGEEVSLIVLHHTGSASVVSDLATLRSSSSRVSAHFLLDRDGTIYELVNESESAWHAGKSNFRGRSNVNRYSIGIELCNLGDGVEPFTEQQYVSLERLLRYLVAKHGIASDHLVGHRDVSPGRKIDPADNFDWDRVRRNVYG